MREAVPLKTPVVIPAYNAAPYLDECLRPAPDQTHPHTEIIAVDDGSTDSSPGILDGYADRIRAFQKENTGTAPVFSISASRMPGGLSMRPGADDAPRPHAAAQAH